MIILNTNHNLRRLLLALAVLWLVVGGFLLLQLWPDMPKSSAKWVFLVVLGPPLYVFGEVLFGWLFSLAYGKAISNREFSGRRIVVEVPIVLGVFTLCWSLS